MTLSIRSKLLGSSLLIIALCAIGSFLAVGRLGDVRQSGKDLHDQAYTPTVGAIYAGSLAKDLQLQNTKYALLVEQLGAAKAGASKGLKDILAANAVDQKGLATAIKDLKSAPAAEQSLANAVSDSVIKYNKALATAVDKKSTPAVSAAAVAEIPADAVAVENAANAFAAASDKFAQTSENKIDDAYSSGRNLIFGALIIAIIIGALLSFLIASRMSKRIALVVERLAMLRDRCAADLREGLNRFAQGDLTQEVTPSTPMLQDLGGDEIGDLGRVAEGLRDSTIASVESYNASRIALTGMIGRVSASAHTLSDASDHLATSSRDAGRAVAEIASAVDDVASGAERQVQAVDGARRMTTE
ncbi:MAG TPA: methyl-accepting chemotaxis protein, partial [Baekduia sp.]